MAPGGLVFWILSRRCEAELQWVGDLENDEPSEFGPQLIALLLLIVGAVLLQLAVDIVDLEMG